jgi:hypothetical protein
MVTKGNQEVGGVTGTRTGERGGGARAGEVRFIVWDLDAQIGKEARRGERWAAVGVLPNIGMIRDQSW